jgi:hypothetical protein
MQTAERTRFEINVSSAEHPKGDRLFSFDTHDEALEKLFSLQLKNDADVTNKDTDSFVTDNKYTWKIIPR